MDHIDALELIEVAAVEPDGLERLAAGDTPDAASLAGHLAGCPDCTAELAGIRRTSATAREAIRSLPDPALRDRTLAFVRAVGRERGHVPAEVVSGPVLAGVDDVGEDHAPAQAPIDIGTARGTRAARDGGTARGGRRRFAVLSGLAAAVLIAGVLGFTSAGVVLAPGTDTDDSQIAVLSDATRTAMRIEQGPDAIHANLTATDGSTAANGTLLFSPSSGELVMTADGLGPLPAGMEYGCWVKVDGQKRRIGHMYPGGDVQTWSGPVKGLADLPPGTEFGVSLVPIGGGAGTQLLTASL